MRDMAREGPYFSKLLLNAIYLDSSRFSSRVEIRSNPADVRTAGWKFRQKCKEYLATAIEKSEITTIQALLMMACSLFALGEEKSVAWTYAGIAFRMIIDLGMHFETSSSGGSHAPSAEELEVRRRVFWAAFGNSPYFPRSYSCDCPHSSEKVPSSPLKRRPANSVTSH